MEAQASSASRNQRAFSHRRKVALLSALPTSRLALPSSESTYGGPFKSSVRRQNFQKTLSTTNVIKKLLLFPLALCVVVPAYAGTYTDAMSRCLANSTTGKDRTDLARWVFSGMAQHPDMADMAAISAEVRDSTNRTAGLLYNRLLTEACSKEFRAAVQNEGDSAAKSAFEQLGRLAMQELLSNPSVAAAFSTPEKYVDRDKLRSIMLSK